MKKQKPQLPQSPRVVALGRLMRGADAVRVPQSSRVNKQESAFFGHKHVGAEQKTPMVQAVFSSVAENYDLMNDLMSGGMHRLWKDYFVQMITPRAGEVILDIAGGTGDIAMRLSRATDGKAKITVCDLNPNMLAEGKKKLRGQRNIKWIHGNAETLPFPDSSADVYCIAFGLRNVTHIDKALTEAARVLKPGGRFFCMEFSPEVSPILKPLYDQYCTRILPMLGKYVADDADAYQYLAESIQRFPAPEILRQRLEQATLARAKYRKLMGGIAVVHSAVKL